MFGDIMTTKITIGKKPENYNTINTIKQQNNKTQNLILNSGIETSEIETMSVSSVRGTRGAGESGNWVDDYYRETAQNLKKGQEPFYVSVSVKGYKSNCKRRQVNIDLVPHSGAKPMHLKSCTVAKSLKWELFRDIPKTDQNQSAWENVKYAFVNMPDIAMAGKIVTRQKYKNIRTGKSPIPVFTISCCSCVTLDELNNTVSVILNFGGTEIIIECEKLDASQTGAEWFMYRGDYKKPEQMEIV